eukprot:m.124510 g.124510  ORF g.124510 m.124510 type:complete len:1128 (+) comp9425_c10_seq1:235-3618(+)
MTIKVSAYRNVDGLYFATTDKAFLTRQQDQASKQRGKQKAATTNAKSTLIIVLDRSGSMGQFVNRLVTKTFPIVMQQLGYDKCTLFTFDSITEQQEMTLKDMQKSKMQCRGCTNFSPCLSALASYLNATQGNVRILTISDGFMSDIHDVVQNASAYAASVRSTSRLVNSQAVRFITSQSSQPDTRGVSSVLQFNTASQVELVDFVATPTNCPELGEMIASIFQKDGLDNCTSLSSNNGADIILVDPFGNAQNSIYLTSSITTFWLTKIPSADDEQLVAHDNDGNAITVEIVEKEPLSMENVDKYMCSTIEMYMQRIRVLKVLHSTSSTEEVSRISSYFENMMQTLDAMSAHANSAKNDIAPSTRARLQALESSVVRRRKMLMNQLCELANDNRVHKLNALQQAEYLRQTTVSKNSKGLARRAGKEGGELDEADLTLKVCDEVRAMVTSIGELADVDDATHMTSFWSLESTVGSLRALADYVQNSGDDLLGIMTLAEILRCISIVGVAARGQVGDYPDAMTWRADEVYSGCYVSVADITEHSLLSVGTERLCVPGSGNSKEITNVIPMFDDIRVHKFVRKYAPTVLELCAGIGIRRMIAEVPMTHAYTILAGAWYCADALLSQGTASDTTEGDAQSHRSFVGIITCWRLFTNASFAFGKYFDRVYPYLSAGNASNEKRSALADVGSSEVEGGAVNEKAKKVHFICNNGLTNMLTVLQRAAREGLGYSQASVLRAIYNYEYYQFTKKILNQHADNKPRFVEETLHDLLQLDYDRDGVDVGKPFTPTPEFSFTFKLGMDATLAAKLTFQFKWVQSACLIPTLLEAFATATSKYKEDKRKMSSTALTGEEEYVVNEVRGMVPELSDEVYLSKLGLIDDGDDGMDVMAYQVAGLLQGLVYSSKQLRSDDEKDEMRVEDLQSKRDCVAFARKLVRDIYLKEYESRVKAKQVAEQEKAVEHLIQALLNSGSSMAFVKLMQNGLEYNGVTAVLANASSDGVKDLVAGLSDMSFNIPIRMEKIGLFMLAKVNGTTTSGEEKDVIVWNNGNTFRGELLGFEHVFKTEKKEKRWYSLLKKHKKASSHLYRDAGNRHGHGNSHPSYWALGFKTLDDMKSKVSAEEYAEYIANHVGCCGL